MTTPLLVTGAAGHFGRHVLDTLLAAGKGPLIATTRTPEALKAYAAKGVEVRQADFEKPEGLAAAFRGAGRALLISTDALDRPGRRLEQHRAAIAALVAAGVRHVVYTSIIEPRGSVIGVAADHLATEEALLATGLELTILRNNLYADLLLGALPPALASGQLVDARGTGRVAHVTRADCAEAAAAALASQAGGRRTLDITGPRALSSDEVAALASELSGKPLKHVSVPVPALVEGLMAHAHFPRPVAELFGTFDQGIARGELARVSPAFKELTGREGTDLRDFLKATRGVWAGA